MKANQILLQMKYARIIYAFAQLADIDTDKALDFFYHSVTYEMIREGVSELHCRSDEYLAELLLDEYKLSPDKQMKNLQAMKSLSKEEFEVRMRT